MTFVACHLEMKVLGVERLDGTMRILGKVMRGMHSKESAQKIIIEACKIMAEVSMFNDKAKTAVDKAKRYHNSKKNRRIEGQLVVVTVSVLPAAAVVAPFSPSSSTTTCASLFVFFTVPFFFIIFFFFLPLFLSFDSFYRFNASRLYVFMSSNIQDFL